MKFCDQAVITASAHRYKVINSHFISIIIKRTLNEKNKNVNLKKNNSKSTNEYFTQKLKIIFAKQIL